MKQNKILFASKSTFLVFIIFFIFSGCGLKQESLSINHYGIDFKTQKKAEVSKLKSILIEEVNVNRSFNLTSIFYSTKPYLFEEYAQNRWINLPSNMIYNQLTDSFIASNIFENVVLKDKKIIFLSNYILFCLIIFFSLSIFYYLLFKYQITWAFI